ncbi:MAG: LysR family transcriptional regulator [Alphaproteobacteria bacterium PA4]|nr:MAG: LysR family transcriptional regulator [Alphaproteobacteria bacterium PA4]
MDLATLSLFIDVARQGSFSAVARQRDLDPSQVSRAIAGLEAELGLRLFQRTTRRLALTEAGSAYLARIEPLVDELAAAGDLARVAEGVEGRVRLTASVAYALERLVPLLPAFRARWPGLKLELIMSDANLDLIAEHVDLAIRLGPAIPAGAIGVQLHSMRYGLVASPAYLASAPPLREPADLARHRCLIFAGPLGRRDWLFDDGSSTTTVQVDGDFTLSSPLGIRDAARAGMGPALLPDWLVAADLAAGRLVDALPGHVATTASFGSGVWLIYPSRSWLPAKVRVTIDFLRDRLGTGGR